ncbi:LytR family transcriptional regulator, partial [Pauljensenia sp. UMB3104]|nr:LytR family transcriptional regulator [Pauljensenia sp. UMB3104]
LSPRQRFLQERQRRQNMTFAVTIVIMLVLALLSALILTGIVSAPFGNSFSKAEKFATSGKVPCPPEKALPVDPASVKVQVLNTTSRQGIASDATEM